MDNTIITSNDTSGDHLTTTNQEQMNIVIVGHVDHGKSTFIGRLLADTKSLPEGKLEQVKAMCDINSRPFEYAFLLDALKDEQSQGITIDTARSFFKTDKRHYIIIDAPGHIEFLKNMITGAARAEAALLLIDAKEGVQENSRRHGYMLSLLGIKKVIVLVNKMDLVNYDQDVYHAIEAEYRVFLKHINVEPTSFIPISARDGDNLVTLSPHTPWFTGRPALEQIDAFEKEKDKIDQVFRMPVQDIYKFTEENDDRRIVAGSIETGTVSVGDDVVFYPSGKHSKIKSIEQFNAPVAHTARVGEAVGFTLTEEIYIRPGEMMCKVGERPSQTGHMFKVNIFWLGKTPMIKDKKYKIKLGTGRTTVYLTDILNVLDASNLESSKKERIERHDVSECIIETIRPLAVDLASELENTSRFVIIDNYEIAGGGIIIENQTDSTALKAVADARNYAWTKSIISTEERAAHYKQQAQVIVLTGPENIGKYDQVKHLEKALFDRGHAVYCLGLSNILLSMTRDNRRKAHEDREEHIRRLGELGHLFCDAGLILLSSISELDNTEMQQLENLVSPYKLKVIDVDKHQQIDVDTLLIS